MVINNLLEIYKRYVSNSDRYSGLKLYLMVTNTMGFICVIICECLLAVSAFQWLIDNYEIDIPYSAFLTACIFLLQAIILFFYAHFTFRMLEGDNTIAKEYRYGRKAVSAFVDGFLKKSK